ncbi:hypothetical protein ACIGFJ_17640 [Brevundimonas diminuta]|uniref:hypothetical protein n=1 Tax=Brevundimonas diminuta TaxID=293 RepID=UPI0037C5BD4A
MSAEFDLSDFDADPTAADHTALLDEIRQAATSGVRSASAPLVAAASEVQRQVKELRAAERSIQAATASITAARSALFWDNAKHLLLYAAVGGLVLGGGRPHLRRGGHDPELAHPPSPAPERAVERPRGRFRPLSAP